MVVMMNNNLHLMSIFADKENPSTDHTCKLSHVNSKISQVFHCEGLLLCISEGLQTRFLVSNPYLGQTRCIKPRFSDRPFTYALGYEENNRSVKLLRFLDYYDNESGEQFFWYEIYDFDSDLWRTLEVTPTWRIASWDLGVSLKGNTYWCATERNSDMEVLADGIICFDFTKERFGPLLPLPFSAWESDDNVTLSCVREEKLAVLLQHNEADPYELDIWITTKIDPENVSWSKFMRVDIGPDNVMMTPHKPYVTVLSIVGNFFIDEEKKVAMGFNAERPTKFVIIGEAGYVRKLDILGEPADPNWTPHLCAYVPNILKIKQPAEGERKQESKLEKRRYGENMSRLVAYERWWRQTYEMMIID